jgi:hypothetical protein
LRAKRFGEARRFGYWARHPFVNSNLQRMLAKWADKLCTAGGFMLPAFALADDGYPKSRLRLDSAVDDQLPPWHPA